MKNVAHYYWGKRILALAVLITANCCMADVRPQLYLNVKHSVDSVTAAIYQSKKEKIKQNKYDWYDIFYEEVVRHSSTGGDSSQKKEELIYVSNDNNGVILETEYPGAGYRYYPDTKTYVVQLPDQGLFRLYVFKPSGEANLYWLRERIPASVFLSNDLTEKKKPTYYLREYGSAIGAAYTGDYTSEKEKEDYGIRKVYNGEWRWIYR